MLQVSRSQGCELRCWSLFPALSALSPICLLAFLEVSHAPWYFLVLTRIKWMGTEWDIIPFCRDCQQPSILYELSFTPQQLPHINWLFSCYCVRGKWGYLKSIPFCICMISLLNNIYALFADLLSISISQNLTCNSKAFRQDLAGQLLPKHRGTCIPLHTCI